MSALFWLVMSAFPAAGSARDVRAGIGVVDITPPVGFRMSGYFSERLSTGTHDPLQAKALVLQQGQTTLALVLCDLIGVSRRVTDGVRRAAFGRTGIPPENIAIAGTHTHTGPLYEGVLREHFHKLAISREGRDPCESVDYPAFLIERITRSIEQAKDSLRPVNLRVAVVEQNPQISFNRRFHMKDGSVVFNPGPQNPNIVRPAGPIDPAVTVIVLEEGNRPFATLTNFAMHLDTTGGTLYSADYPGYLEQALRRDFGAAFVSLFATGTCGDINHIDVSVPGRRTAEELGTLLARTVRDAVRQARPASPDLAAASARVTVSLQRFAPDERQRAEEQMALVGSRELPFLDQVRAYKILSLAARGPTIDLEVQVFRVAADTAVVLLPGEVFVELGLAIRKASPFRTTLVVELVNDCPHYIPTRKAFAEGSYETVNSIVQSGGGEAMVDAAVDLLKRLAPAP